MSKLYTEEMVKLDQVFLDLSNPRHEELKRESDVYEYLIEDANILVLAKDIVENGLNPLELFALISDNKPSKQTYVVAEGNRRAGVLKLLLDPELAPSKYKKQFSKLAKNWIPIKKIRAAIFKNKQDVKIWLKRTHDGSQGGKGRQTWSSEQKARFTGTKSNNNLALKVLDYAEKKNFITKEERAKKISTVQRYLNSPLVRESLGITCNSQSKALKVNRSIADFDNLLCAFIGDLKSGVVHSRSDKSQREEYSRMVSQKVITNDDHVDKYDPFEHIETKEDTSNQGTDTNDDTESDNTNDGESNSSNSQSSSPPNLSNLYVDESIVTQLNKYQNQKLISLYNSFAKISLTQHTPILAIGVWAFLESLAANIGKNSQTDILSFFSVDRLLQLNIGDKQRMKALRSVIERILRAANSTKHHDFAAEFNSKQLYNDLQTVSPMIESILAKENEK